jgi:CheY-like chemotaxis protein
MPEESMPMRLNVRVVDDHADTLDLLPRVLEKWGHSCVTAKSVGEANVMALALRFDVVLCDYELPDGNCCNLLQGIRKMYPVHGVAITGHGDETHRRQAIAAGYVDYMVKPLNLSLLQEILEVVEAKRKSPT